MTAADDAIPATIEWRGDHVRLIDQRRLPSELTFIEAHTVSALCDAISTLAVRGAPALGVAGALGVALASAASRGGGWPPVCGEPLEQAAAALIATRPTAVTLAWGVEQALAADDPV